ncbi:MAG: histidinol dehydrogenase [Helicobacter sp.]|nr:histidinol dehydrogenase [Helicobacter sp.]
MICLTPILKTTDMNFKNDFAQILLRGKMDITGVRESVQNILDDVRENGIEAVLSYVSAFDSWQPKSLDDLLITQEECKKAYENLSLTTKEALHKAYERISAFHQKQKEKSWFDIESNGTVLGQKVSPIQSAGLYIPGGKAAYPSSLLMNAIPAVVAGVEEIVVCSPTPYNQPNQLLLSALHLFPTFRVYKIGGASAIGLMAYGDSKAGIKNVDVITGPGNIYVATAKKLVFGDVNIDMIAGPSEIGIIAQSGANARYIAWDLLSQAEHDELASAILITDDLALIESVRQEIQDILPTLKRREITESSMKNRSVFIHTRDIQESIDLMNEIAPEHLELLVDEPFSLLPYIKNAGAIFLGEQTSEPIGDYLAGPNHTLPTGGSARFFSPLGVEHFMKKTSIISFSKQAMRELGTSCAHLAEIEGLQSHQQAVLARVDSLK